MALGTLGSTLNDELNRLANGGTYRDMNQMVDEALAAKQWANRENINPYSTDTVGILNEIAGLGLDKKNWLDFNGVCNYIAGTTGLPAAAALRQVYPTTDLLTGVASYYVDATAPTNWGSLGYVYLNGVAGNYLSVPDSSALDITGDIDLRVYLAADDWTTGVANNVIIGKWGSSTNQRAYRLVLDATGKPQLSWSTDGTSSVNQLCSDAVPGVDGQPLWVRATLDVDNGASGYEVRFFTSTNGTSWTQLGTTITGVGTTSIFNSNFQLEIGATSPAVQYMAGKYYRAQVLNGIGGTIVLDVNIATDYRSSNQSFFTATTGQTVTVNGVDTIANLGAAGSLLPTTLGSSTAADSNDPKFLDHTGTNYVYMPGVASNYISVPDSAALRITGDIDLRAYVAPDTWTPAAAMAVVSKWNSSTGLRSYTLQISTTGALTLNTSADGTTGLLRTSTVNTGFSAGQAKWIRATLDVDNGASGNTATFFTSDDGSNWTQLGATVVNAGTTSIVSNATNVEVGSISIGTGSLFAGKVFRAQILNGIGGTTVLDVDTSTLQTGADAYIVPTTYSGAAGAYFTGTGLSLNGVAGNYASSPDSAAISVTGDIDLRVQVALNDWTPAAISRLLSKRGDGSTQQSYDFFVNTDGTLGFFWTTTGSGGGATVPSTVATGITDGATKWVRVTMDVNNGASGKDIKFFTSDNGSDWTQLGSTQTSAGTTSIFDGTAQLDIGANINGANSVVNGTIYRAQVLSGIDGFPVFDATFVGVPANSLRMIESSTYKAVVTLNTTRYCTINRSTSGRKTVAVTQPTWLFGTDDYMEVNNRYTDHLPASENYVYLSGASGNYMSVSDNPPLDVTADLDLRAKISLDNWATGGSQTIVSKRTSIGNQRSYRMVVSGTGGIFLELSSDGTTTTVISSTTITSFAAGATKWIRATFDSDNGAGGNTTKFFTSDDGTTWTQLGADVVNSGVFTIYSGTAAVELGSCNGGLTDRATGKIYRGQILSGINGTTVLDANAATITSPSQTTFTDSSSNAYTVTINRSGVGTFVSTNNYLYLPGVNGNYVSTPDAAALDITGDIDLRVKVALDDWTPGATDNILLAKRTISGNQQSYFFNLNSTGFLVFYWTTDGSTVNTRTSTISTGITDGSTRWVRATLDVDNGAGGNTTTFFTSTDGITWTQLGLSVTVAGITSIFSSTSPLEIGSQNVGTTTARGKFFRAQVLNGINGTVAFDANFETSITSLNQASFTESSANAATVTINRSGSAYRSAGITTAGYLYPGATNTFAASATDFLNFGASDSFTAVAVVRQFATVSQFDGFLSKRLTTANGGNGYEVTASSSSNGSRIGTDDGPNSLSAELIETTVGRLVTATGVVNRATNTSLAYVNTNVSAATSISTLGSLSNIEALRFGIRQVTGAYANMELYAGAVFRTALTAAQVRQISNYFINREVYL